MRIMKARTSQNDAGQLKKGRFVSSEVLFYGEMLSSVVGKGVLTWGLFLGEGVMLCLRYDDMIDIFCDKQMWTLSTDSTLP